MMILSQYFIVDPISIPITFTLIVLTFFLTQKLKTNSSSNKIKKERRVHTERLQILPSKKKPTKVCPFSKNSNFIVELQDNLPPSPLELYEDWIDEYSHNNANTNKPLAARWLNAGISGQDVAGKLRAGLKPMRDSKYFLLQDKHLIREELLLKKKALDDPIRYPHVFVAEKKSMDAQRECLELFLDFLPRRYPEFYEYNIENESITVKPISSTFFIKDYIDKAPLELCERIVQEDLVLMRPDDNCSDVIQSYIMSAAAVVFSFDLLQERLGKPAEFIHSPVPGYMTDIRTTLNLTFSKLAQNRILWRNNWDITSKKDLDSTDTYEYQLMNFNTSIEIKNKFLRVEYQTIRRLPRSNYILFTIRTMVDPIYSLETVDKAAACLAASMRGMSLEMLKYKGIHSVQAKNEFLAYLDSIVK